MYIINYSQRSSLSTLESSHIPPKLTPFGTDRVCTPLHFDSQNDTHLREQLVSKVCLLPVELGCLCNHQMAQHSDLWAKCHHSGFHFRVGNTSVGCFLVLKIYKSHLISYLYYWGPKQINPLYVKVLLNKCFEFDTVQCESWLFWGVLELAWEEFASKDTPQTPSRAWQQGALQKTPLPCFCEEKWIQTGLGQSYPTGLI